MKIFQADNFTDPKIKYRAIPDNQNLQNIVNIFFPKAKKIKFYQLDRKEINSENFKFVMAGRRCLLRKHKLHNTLKRVDFFLNLLDGLKEKGLPVCGVVPSQNGDLYVKKNGYYYSVFEFISGQHFKPNSTAYRSIAKGLAHLHKFFQTYPENYRREICLISQGAAVYYNVVRDYKRDDFIKIKSIITQKKHLSRADRLILDELPYIEKKIKIVKEHEINLKKLTRIVIHSDFHPHNVIVENNRLKAIMDFDGVRISERGRDIAMAVYRFGRQFYVNNPQSAINAPRLAKVFLKAYSGINPITVEEEKFLPLLVLDEFLTKLLFVLRGIYRAGNETWAGDLGKFIAAIHEIDYFWPEISD